MAIGGGLRRNSGSELKLYLKGKRNTKKTEVKRFHFTKMTSSEDAKRRMERVMNYLMQTNISGLQ